jgi:sugar lactone lactonase YvrE
MPRIAFIIGVISGLLCSSPATAIEKLYFADVGNNEILRCNLDGTYLEPLVTTGIENVGSIAIDRTGGLMYWTDWPSATAHIQCADLDGGNVQTLLSDLHGPFGLALDVVAGKMYWTEFNPPRIRRANLDGTDAEDLVDGGITYPLGIALDLAAGKMYWCDGSTVYYARIMRADLDGANAEVLVTAPTNAPQDIALDTGGGKMYWSDLGTGSWFRADLEGSDIEEIMLSAWGTPVGVALDLAAGKLYVSDYGQSVSEIKRANLDGSDVEGIITSGIGAVYALTLGPDEAECSDGSLQGFWLAVVTGVEEYDYSVYLDFDGMGTIVEMGSLAVPYPAGTYAIGPECDLSGTIWTDGYTSFTGHVDSDTQAEIDIGQGPMQLLRVTDVGRLEGCWAGYFAQDSPTIVYEVTLHIDSGGSVALTTGFVGPTTGRLFTEAGHLAGHLLVSAVGRPPDEIMFMNVWTDAQTVMSGTYDMDSPFGSASGSFYLHRCAITAIAEGKPGVERPAPRCFPNPFNPRTTIAFTMDRPGPVQLAIHDASGRLVRNLMQGEYRPAGRQEVSWDGRDEGGRPLPSGVFFYRLAADGRVATGRMTLLR